MTLDQLKILQKIVETGSIGNAAKALYRTQPTLSVAMKKLEDELELELFSRDQYRATLTDTGGAVFRKVESILEKIEELENFTQHLALGEEAEIRIAFTSIPMKPLLDILKKCEAKYPHTQIHLFAEYLWGSLDRLTNGDVDLTILPWFQPTLELETIPFFSIRRFSVAAANFPPLQGKTPIPQETMKQYVQVILKDSSPTPRKESYGVITGGKSWKVNDQYTKKEIIQEGMGWGSLPEYLIKKELEEGSLVPLGIENYPQKIEAEVRVARLLNKPYGPVATYLWNLFQEVSGKVSSQ